MTKETLFFILHNDPANGDCEAIQAKLDVGDYYARWGETGNALEYFRVVSRVFIPGEDRDEWTFHVDKTAPL